MVKYQYLCTIKIISMLKIFPCNMFDENCYVLSDDTTKECVIIDCGALYEEEADAIIHYINSEGLKPVHLLSTHGHLDHNFGNAAMLNAFGLKAEVNAADEPMLLAIKTQAAKYFGVNVPCEAAPVGGHLKEGDEVKYGSQTLKVIHTPGHSQGGVVLYNAEQKIAFTGDTLFQMSIGRTDLEGGSYDSLMSSLRVLADRLPGDTVIYPGHGPKSDMATEVKYNPYFR